jgi:hypothetical protein
MLATSDAYLLPFWLIHWPALAAHTSTSSSSMASHVYLQSEQHTAGVITTEKVEPCCTMSINKFTFVLVTNTVSAPVHHPTHISHTSCISFPVRLTIGRMLSNIRWPPARTFLGKSGFIITSVTMYDIMFAFLAIWTYVHWR